MTPLHLLHMYEHEIRWAKQAKLNKLQSWTKLEGANSIEPKLWLELLLDSTNFGSQLGTSTMRSLSMVRYSDRPNVRFGRTVRPNCSAKLLLCGLAQMTELFSAEHRTLFCITFNGNGILSHFCSAKWPTCTWSLGKIAKRMPTEPKLEWNYHINLKLFVCFLDLGFTPD